MQANDFEQAYADFIDRRESDEAQSALFSIVRTSFTAGWQAADTRAQDCASMNSIRFNNQPHTRPDGSRWFTALGIEKNYNYGENAGSGCYTAEAQMKSWMGSTGHRADFSDSGDLRRNASMRPAMKSQAIKKRK